LRLVVQRVRSASVTWEGSRNQIGPGLVVLVGVGPEDTEADSGRLAERVAQLRIFKDSSGKTNLSLVDVGGEALVISQFTLYADLSRGRRPGFAGAAPADLAERLYADFATRLAGRGITVRTGSFGAEMDVELINQGPVTIVLSNDEWPTRVH
jgi:D-tyrosyl-tRNA(Tyr) deacylase